MFIDNLKIKVTAGSGGNGCVSFRREKFVPKGGPDGGDGGDGGSIILFVDSNLSTLKDLDNLKHYKAGNGKHGEGSGKTGASAADLVISVPPGTLVKNAENADLLFDLVEPGKAVLVAKGGRGGRGNVHFKSPTHRAPRKAESGFPGEELWLDLELKLIAEVGIIGFPNAGKSTLISRISAAKPAIDDYPFTTLTPNLGVVKTGEYRSIVVADIPGLIEGAHKGAGLGIRFLKHVERTKLLVHLVDVSETGRDPLRDIEILNGELAAFSRELGQRPQIIAASKIDAVRNNNILEEIRNFCSSENIVFLGISSVTGSGLKQLLAETVRMLASVESNT